MTTILLPPEANTTTNIAMLWVWRGDLALAEHYLRKLTDAERAQARMVLLRLALLIQSMTPEGVAAAALAPDSLGGE